MGIRTSVAKWLLRSSGTSLDSAFWAEMGFGAQSVTGISINQQSALRASSVIAAVSMLSEDVAKLGWGVFSHAADNSRKEVTNHYLSDLLHEPNEWMNGFEFREMLQMGIVMRGNGYAIIRRSNRGTPIEFWPWNPDNVFQWVATNGDLYYRLVGQNVHEQALLARLGTAMVPAEDMIHIRGFSLNGLVGMSRISLAKEAIALGLSQEQQAARWMGQGARPSGMLTTDQTLTVEAAKRLANDFKENVSGLENTGKVLVGEQGLKFQPFSMTSADLEFIASRQFQLQEVARIFRIPPHMMGEMSRSTNNNIAQMAQEYINFTLTGYTNRWRSKFSSKFGLRKEGLSIEFNYDDLTTADMTSRINNLRIAVMSMILTPNEARISLGKQPVNDDPEADKLQKPANMAAPGSQSSGTTDGAGRPEGS